MLDAYNCSACLNVSRAARAREYELTPNCPTLSSPPTRCLNPFLLPPPPYRPPPTPTPFLCRIVQPTDQHVVPPKNIRTHLPQEINLLSTCLRKRRRMSQTGCASACQEHAATGSMEDTHLARAEAVQTGMYKSHPGHPAANCPLGPLHDTHIPPCQIQPMHHHGMMAWYRNCTSMTTPAFVTVAWP